MALNAETGRRKNLAFHVAKTIRGRIRQGEYQPEEALPSVRELGEEFDVSLNVIQRALLQLKNENVVTTQQGRGTRVVSVDPCSQTALLFGMVIPYGPKDTFGHMVLMRAEQAFSQRNNFLVLRSSEHSWQKEREITQQFEHNGVDGLLVWPVVNDVNASFLKKLAEDIPVVLVDRPLPNSGLPCVYMDWKDAARRMVHEFMSASSENRLLLVEDDQKVPGYQDFEEGVRDALAELQCADRVSIEYFPIAQAIRKWGHGDFSGLDALREHFFVLVEARDVNCIFSPHSDFLDYVVAQSEEHRERVQSLQFGTFQSPLYSPHSVAFWNLNCKCWHTCTEEVIAQAADQLQDWILGGIHPPAETLIPFGDPQ